MLANMAARADAETWALDDATLEQAIARVRSFAAERYPDLDAPQQVQQRFVLNPVRF
ncbi:MAG: methyltransferase type 11, partial [Roseiflexaceae bacterium]|nr:methyltransferase type 11 [Roseiflexaceae bacterium]